MGSKRKNAEQLTKDLEDVIRRLYTQIQGTDEEKREAIIQSVETKIKSLEAQEKAKQETAKATRFKARAAEIPDDLETLMREFNYGNKSSVCSIMRIYGIYGKIKILQAIQEKAKLGITEEEANAQIAQEGNVTLDAVARIRQENREPQRKLGDKTVRFKARAAEIPDDIYTLMKEFGYASIFSVFKNMKNNEIYTKRKILKEIQEKAKLGISEEEANAQIAREGNVTLDAVARIRQENCEPQSKLGDKTARFKARAAEIPDDTETLMKEFNYKNRKVVTVGMARYGIYGKKRILQAIQEKAELGISEEEANKQIAREGHVTVEAVIRIRNQKEEKQEEARKNKEQEQEQEDRLTRFKQRAAEIPDDTETLMKEFNYKSRQVVNACMASYGIYGKIKILQAIREKAELGISEEEANEQIAREGNVTAQAVARIRQGISKPKTRSTRDNVQISSTQIKTSEKLEVQTDARTVAVQSRVVEPKTEQSAKTTEEPKVKIWGILESTQTPRKPITHTTDTKPEVKPHVAKPSQKAKQVQKSEIEEARQREIEQRRLEEELQQVAEKNAQREQAIKQETEAFLKMAKGFLPSSSIRGKFQHIDDYDMILIRRKYKILSREEVEELIETTTLSDEEIAQKANGEVTGVEKVRKSIRRRQELIASVSDTKRNFIIGLIKEPRLY